uniref:Lysozyme like 4 n=1 Tax=Sus scrofa TaxID=9823 RepID=A0A4X1TLS8_PIG
MRDTALKTVSRPCQPSPPRLFPYQPLLGLPQLSFKPHPSCSVLGVCLAYFESKFNPTAVYDNLRGDYTGYGLFQIRNHDWCDHGKNRCHVSCSALLNPNLKETIKCAKKIVQGKRGMGAWPSWTLNCQNSDTLARWLDGCKL